MQRFAEPRCEAFGGPGAPCRPFQEAENKTLSFPNALLYCDNVFMQYCPCARGLICDLDTFTCGRRGAWRPARPTQRPQTGRNPYGWRRAKPERQLFADNAVAPYHDDDGDNNDNNDQFDQVDATDVPVAYERLSAYQMATVRRQPQWPAVY